MNFTEGSTHPAEIRQYGVPSGDPVSAPQRLWLGRPSVREKNRKGFECVLPSGCWPEYSAAVR
ncbi:hypothetical protein [Kibdelosporangium philippinense]|uniref:hypothetical protein n=1 Tax=Kibdelosporangium philippinense TaxID=211113 RepID=UPI00360CE750